MTSQPLPSPFSTAPAPFLGMQASPSYIPVPARHTLQRPAPPAQAPTMHWPPAVRTYVTRAFEAWHDQLGMSQEELASRLKEIVTEAATSGKVNDIDWTTYDLPHQFMLRERMDKMMDEVVPTNMNGLSVDQRSPGSNSRKRKPDVDAYDRDTRSASSKGGLEGRITGKADKKQKKADAFRANLADTKSREALERRKQRFGYVSPSSSPFESRGDTPSTENATGPVVGTCQRLDKNYFRLTSAPKPEEVRPLPVLEEMFKLLLERWKSEHKYSWVCDQLKSMRQDLTVQHIKQPFTIKVYECHARIALEMGDLGEYNQCQTQLRGLYKLNLGGSPEEFTAYRILYTIYTCNRTGMNDVLADLTEADKQMEGVAHALKVRAALASGNYHRFFKLYQATPFMGAYLLDLCLPRERLAALAAICKSYKPDASLDFLVEERAFGDENDSDPDAGRRECVQFISDHGGHDLIQKREDGEVRFLAGSSKNIFETAKQGAFRRVDIKGQI